MRRTTGAFWLLLSLVSGIVMIVGCHPSHQQDAVSAFDGGENAASPGGHQPVGVEPSAREPEKPVAVTVDEWGIRIERVMVSAAGYMLDMRYTVLDAEKAAPLFERSVKPYLMDQASGVKVAVPRTAKVGPLRQTSDQIEVGRIYYMLFANPGKFIKPGNEITIVIGDMTVPDLVVQQ